MSCKKLKMEANRIPEMNEDGKKIMKELFLKELNVILSKKTSEKSEFYFFTEQKYSDVIRQLQKVETDGFTDQRQNSALYRQEKRMVARFVIQSQSFGDAAVRTLRDRQSGKAYMKNSQIFDIFWDCHHLLAHGKRVAMENRLRQEYQNVSREAVEVFLKLCSSCQLNKNRPKKTIVVRPIISKQMNSSGGQVDLIDYQSLPDGEFMFVMVYQDHLTKYVSLKPLKTKTAKDVASALIEIFGTFGAPSLLHSDNGTEFANHLINELETLWPGLKIIHGTPWHSQSQGSVETAKQDIENRVACYLKENNTTHWTKFLPLIQFSKNATYHTGIGCTPYCAMFGNEPKNGLIGTEIPQQILKSIETEEDVKGAIAEQVL